MYVCNSCQARFIAKHTVEEHIVLMHPNGEEMSGLKNDSGKPDLTLVSNELMVSLARVREFGTKKYSRDNWKKGFKVTRSLAASLRHIFAFLSGETLDPESGLSHLGHAVASIEHAIYDMEHRPENDDRSIKPVDTKRRFAVQQ